MPVKVNLVTSNNRLESRMREIRQSGSAGGEVQINEPSLPLSKTPCVAGQSDGHSCPFSPVVRGEGGREAG